jgi:predicted Zn-dependent protease with MMP-like domain
VTLVCRGGRKEGSIPDAFLVYQVALLHCWGILQWELGALLLEPRGGTRMRPWCTELG